MSYKKTKREENAPHPYHDNPIPTTLDEKHKQKKPILDKGKPNFGLSGLLAEETNTRNGVVLKHTVPPEARKPVIPWKLFVFKGDGDGKNFALEGQSTFLIGKDLRVADLPLRHDTVSKQHAVIVFRLRGGDAVRPYLLDLESTNGTFINGHKIEPSPSLLASM